MRATGNHPYLLADPAPGVLLAANDNDALHIAPGGTWKVVQNLKPGDHIRTALRGVDAVTGAATAGDETLTVVAITLDRAPTRVYNLEVRTHHSFAVGELGEWVHNGRFTDAQQIVLDWAKFYQKSRITPEDAKALIELAHSCGLPARGPEVHPGRPYGQFPHIHIGPIDHIFLKFFQ